MTSCHRINNFLSLSLSPEKIRILASPRSFYDFFDLPPSLFFFIIITIIILVVLENTYPAEERGEKREEEGSSS